MFAPDTNVLVRLLVSDDLAQQKAVRKRLDRILAAGDEVVLTTVALAELAWVLDAAYGYDREAIVLARRSLLDTPPFVSPEKGQVLEALDAYTSGPADFSDYLIVALAGSAGAGTLLTFDRELLRHSACKKP
jgi:predicted nucleic-acid-binding protein